MSSEKETNRESSLPSRLTQSISFQSVEPFEIACYDHYRVACSTAGGGVGDVLVNEGREGIGQLRAS